MTLPWVYMPNKDEIKAYRQIYSKYYGEDKVNIFDMAVELNRNLLNMQNSPVNKSGLMQKYNFKTRIIYAARIILKGY